MEDPVSSDRRKWAPDAVTTLILVRITSHALRAHLSGLGGVRLLPLAGAAAMVHWLHVPQSAPRPADWLTAMVSAALVVVGGRRPLAVTLAQSALASSGAVADALGETWGAGPGVAVAQILASVALAELALRRPPVPAWCGAVAVALASAVTVYVDYPAPAKALIVLLYAGVPLLLGSYLRSQRQLAEEAEQRARAAEQAREWEAAAARAAERSAIVRELHDVVAHHVASIVLRVGIVLHVMPPSTDPRVDEALRDVHGIGGQALADLRRLVAVLRDPQTTGEPALMSVTDIREALKDVLDRTRQAGVEVETAVDPAILERLGTAHRHTVLRLVQEGLTNALKHAGHGARARVQLEDGDDGQVVVEVSDDGGHGVAGHAAEPGHGLLVMRERVGLLGGELTVGPRAGGGWALRALVPQAPPGHETVEVPGEAGARS